MSDLTIPVSEITERYKVSRTSICKVAPVGHMQNENNVEKKDSSCRD